MERSSYSRHSGSGTREASESGNKAVFERRMTVIATVTAYGTGSDSDGAVLVADKIIDSQMMRPSLADIALDTISKMANNELLMIHPERREDNSVDAAVVMIRKNKARFFISGVSAAYHFSGGKLLHRSESGEAPAIGKTPRFDPRLEKAFDLGRGENIFLTADRALSESISDDKLEQMAASLAGPEEFMDALIKEMGPERSFSAGIAFLPPRKHLFF
ncbi:MAG: hypothetical protein K5871_00470 [Lachnospiraceae bacterium]|nr:hypothetical protein [Lachnospiraceae bacterium]